jgi:hypothetical protein
MLSPNNSFDSERCNCSLQEKNHTRLRPPGDKAAFF